MYSYMKEKLFNIDLPSNSARICMDNRKATSAFIAWLVGVLLKFFSTRLFLFSAIGWNSSLSQSRMRRIVGLFDRQRYDIQINVKSNMQALQILPGILRLFREVSDIIISTISLSRTISIHLSTKVESIIIIWTPLKRVAAFRTFLQTRL